MKFFNPFKKINELENRVYELEYINMWYILEKSIAKKIKDAKKLKFIKISEYVFRDFRKDMDRLCRSFSFHFKDDLSGEAYHDIERIYFNIKIKGEK